MQGNQKVKSIFLGQVRRKTYNYYGGDTDIYETSEFAEYQKIYECELDRPPLEKDEKIHIPELDLVLQVASVLKSVDGSITYQTNYTIKKIEDEETKKSLVRAQNKKEQYFENKRIEESKPKEEEKEVTYNEDGTIARCLSHMIINGNDEQTIIANIDHHGNLTLVNLQSNSIFKLDNYSRKRLIEFIAYVSTNIDLR